ncbi:pyruvate dehydrogenase E2 component (dihydrolipoamide acetyltransferase) [Planomicrobium koreense]|uniref:Dihydrolipoamide acetyltransferase component of pyruvate dehydrogenase complex n=1 Tax=Planococcus koreensis TaxID=112331 RepID=A0A7W8CQP5_9BACL|nr:dihydrolipoamide acetyltransferase family protein [Planococcus koreensis]MBB5179811.1 pyruvate dehydrogenase E2 component (dihydrolipoamide acetyltransferase) [Planococcus koreensis]
MFEVKLPKLRDDVEESLVVVWFVSEGDAVEKGDRLVEVQTEKEVSELDAEESGKVKEIVVNRGESAKVGEVLALIDTEGSPKPNPVKQKAAVKKAEAPDASTGTKPEVQKITKQVSPKEEGTGEEAPKMVRIAPGLRKLARDLDVDLAQVSGTGRNGNITGDDIRKAASPPAEVIAEKVEPEGMIPLSGIRGTIARRMVESLQQSAQLTETAWADVTKLVSKKEKLGDAVGWTALLAKAVAQALSAHPHMNGQIKDNKIELRNEINLGFAVDTELGLQVAVVQESEKVPAAELHAKLVELAGKARGGKLAKTESSGSTFTITSLGGYRVQFFTPIINPPEIAILGIGRIEDHLVLEKGKVRVRKRLPLSLTVDHRAVDGAPAAKFLDELISLLEKPKLFLEKNKE